MYWVFFLSYIVKLSMSGDSGISTRREFLLVGGVGSWIIEYRRISLNCSKVTNKYVFLTYVKAFLTGTGGGLRSLVLTTILGMSGGSSASRSGENGGVGTLGST